MLDPHCSLGDLGQKRELYRRELARHGHSIVGRDLPMARLIAVADTATEARRVAEQGAAWTVSAYANKDNAGKAISAGLLSQPDDVAIGDAAAVERYVREVMIHGTPEQVVDQIRALQTDIGLDYLLCAPVSHTSFTLFTEQVLPKFL
jgi:alkanesulfonate monooxygenase SsuD/methylene tetrahydromethanopterin reductase-like flavin-dependent oxidoreductase (luciferase family)